MLATAAMKTHRRTAAGKMHPVSDLPVPDLPARVRALPAAQPLMARIRETPGVYVVGGAIRDVLLGETPYDLDLVVEGDAAAFARSLGGALRVHDRFGTSTVKLDPFTYDIARARSETYAHPGALPDVVPASLAEDLLRRDFTVNAMALALDGGQFRAAPNAREDLEARRLRVLHDASFADDPTRMLRLARYASRLRFAVEPRTRALLDTAVRDGAIRTVSGPRIGSELRLLAREDDPIEAMHALRVLGLDKAIHPQFGQTDEALARRALALLPSEERRDLLALAVAMRGVASPARAELLDALAFHAHDRDAILAAAGRSEELARRLGQASSPSQIAAAVGDAGAQLVALAGALGPDKQAREWLTRLRHVRLEIDGDDLLGAGVPAGPAIGRGLRAALAAKLDGHTAGREAELAAALRAATQTDQTLT